MAVAAPSSGVVGTAGAAGISSPAAFHGNMAWVQAVLNAAPLASAALGWLAVHWPLNFLDVFGRVERWQSPVDRARLEIV